MLATLATLSTANILLVVISVGATRPILVFIRGSVLRTDVAVGSLTSAFAPARLVGLAVKPACAFARPARFPSGLSRP